MEQTQKPRSSQGVDLSRQHSCIFPTLIFPSQYSTVYLMVRAKYLHRFLERTRDMRTNWFYKSEVMDIFVSRMTCSCPSGAECPTCPFAAPVRPHFFQSSCVLKELREQELWYNLPIWQVREYLQGCYDRTKASLLRVKNLDAYTCAETIKFFQDELRGQIKKETE